MTLDRLAGPADRQDVVENPGHVVEEVVSQPPVVITEKEVVFSTAAAVSLPPAVPGARGARRVARDVPAFVWEYPGAAASLSTAA